MSNINYLAVSRHPYVTFCLCLSQLTAAIFERRIFQIVLMLKFFFFIFAVNISPVK